MRKHPNIRAEAAGGARSLTPPAVLPVHQADALQAAVQPLLEAVSGNGRIEQSWIPRAWELYETPEVRFAARQYANAFAATKIVLARRKVLGRDPEPILEPADKAEQKAYELLQTFAGGPEGQVEFMDRMGVYFTVPGDMVAIGSYDPARISESKFAKWDLWSTSEVRWDGQQLRIRTSAVEDRFQEMPQFIKHVRIWNRHPRFGWESDSPVRASMDVLELIGLYDDRLAAEALSRLIGAGVWMIPQGMSLPTSTGDPTGGTPNDFLRLLIEVASTAIKDKRSAAATVPILVEAAAEDIAAAKDSHVSFSSSFDERVGELQERAIRRWATGVDLPAETMLGMAAATHWNASLISEDKVQSFVIPALRRGFGNLTSGFLQPALQQFGFQDPSLVMWFDPSAIKTRVDLADEAQWASDRFMLSDADRKSALGLSQTKDPDNDDLKRQMLLHMAKMKPELVPDILRELGIDTSIRVSTAPSGTDPQPGGSEGAPPAGSGRSGPQADQVTDKRPAVRTPGRAASLETKGA